MGSVSDLFPIFHNFVLESRTLESVNFSPRYWQPDCYPGGSQPLYDTGPSPMHDASTYGSACLIMSKSSKPPAGGRSCTELWEAGR